MSTKAKLSFFALGLLVFTVVASIQSSGPFLFRSGSGVGTVVAINTGNYVSNDYSAVLSGRNNIVGGTSSADSVAVIAGGEDNRIIDGNTKHGTISGGQSNVISNARYATISGGWLSYIAGFSNQVVAGGWLNTNKSFNSAVGGGYKNRIESTGVAGDQGSANTIPGGGSNYIRASYSTIGGGKGNVITNVVGADLAEGNVIGGGLENVICPEGYATIGGGAQNIILVGGGTGFIGGGQANQNGGGVGVISGGYQNTNGALFASIGGGFQNRITTAGDYGLIPGGTANTISAANSAAIGQNLSVTTADTVDIGTADATKLSVNATVATFRGGIVYTSALLVPISNLTNFTADFNYTDRSYLLTNNFHVSAVANSGGSTAPRYLTVKLENLSGSTKIVSLASTIKRAGTNNVNVPNGSGVLVRLHSFGSNITNTLGNIQLFDQ